MKKGTSVKLIDQEEAKYVQNMTRDDVVGWQKAATRLNCIVLPSFRELRKR